MAKRRTKAAADAETNHLEIWGVVEVLGHQTYADRIREASIGGASFIRVDVPDIPRRKLDARLFGTDQMPGRPGFTKFIGAGSIYAITPTTEKAARAAAGRLRTTPVTVVSLPERPALTAADEED